MSCGRKIGPFDCCSVVEGDSETLALDLLGGEVDAVISDPPYGISHDTDYRRFTGGNAPEKNYLAVHGDDRPFDPQPWLRFKRVILFGANCFAGKLPTGSWLVWDKRFSNGTAFLSDGEAAWMNKGHGVYICSITWQGYVRSEETRHPTQKPTELMAWCIEKAGNPETILDPYAGSGSTLVAAKKLGRHFLGFEISPEYCAISRRRLAEIDAQPTLFEPQPEQLTL